MGGISVSLVVPAVSLAARRVGVIVLCDREPARLFLRRIGWGRIRLLITSPFVARACVSSTSVLLAFGTLGAFAEIAVPSSMRQLGRCLINSIVVIAPTEAIPSGFGNLSASAATTEGKAGHLAKTGRGLIEELGGSGKERLVLAVRSVTFFLVTLPLIPIRFHTLLCNPRTPGSVSKRRYNAEGSGGEGTNLRQTVQDVLLILVVLDPAPHMFDHVPLDVRSPVRKERVVESLQDGVDHLVGVHRGISPGGDDASYGMTDDNLRANDERGG